jgi:beta-ketoacyl-acyl-carrier-protein synthase II
MPERIVITGMGTINPLAHNVGDTWMVVLAGESGVGPITLFDSSDLLVHAVCEVKDFDPTDFMSAKDARRRDRYQQFSKIAVQQALDDSGLVVDQLDPTRVGVVISTAIGGIDSIFATFEHVYQGTTRRINPFFVPMFMPNGAAGLAAIDHGFQGPAMSIASACASGSDGIGMAWMLLRAGVIDIAVAGSSEATISKVGVSGFDRVGALTRRSSDNIIPQPFDRERDGLVMGEGAAILVLERESGARARGATIYAELAGHAATADGHHITAPTEYGDGAALAMRGALAQAAVSLDHVDYINAHGTGTVLNDLSETRAIKSVFGDRAYQIPISSTKSMTGHMMGATGALEAILCVQAVRENIVPPTINYRTPDPECDLDYVPNQPREMPLKVAISNALGFGGHNSVLVIREYN